MMPNPKQIQQLQARLMKIQEDLGKETVKNNPNQKGGQSQIGSTAVRSVDANPNAQLDPLQSDRALPPPEFREAQRQFTSSPPRKISVMVIASLS